MVEFSISLESPDQPDVARLIDELDAYQRPLYPEESHHGVDLAALMQSNVIFAVARNADGVAVGCGAVVLEGEQGEIKRMFVSPSARGRSIARRLLELLEESAMKKGCRRFVLETGDLQTNALALYERCGYVRCGPFGSYAEDPNSVFMCKDAIVSHAGDGSP